MWEYIQLEDLDYFAFILRGTKKRALAKSQAVLALKAKLSEGAKFNAGAVIVKDNEGRVISADPLDAPHGPIHKPSAWKGKYIVGETPVRMQSCIAADFSGGFFYLCFNTIPGTHDPDKVKAWLNEVNESIVT